MSVFAFYLIWGQFYLLSTELHPRMSGLQSPKDCSVPVSPFPISVLGLSIWINFLAFQSFWTSNSSLLLHRDILSDSHLYFYFQNLLSVQIHYEKCFISKNTKALSFADKLIQLERIAVSELNHSKQQMLRLDETVKVCIYWWHRSRSETVGQTRLIAGEKTGKGGKHGCR